MSAERRAYLDTSALAKWYLNESNSSQFVDWLQGLDSALVSNLTRIEMRSLLARRRRSGDFNAETESVLFAAFIEDLDRGWLQLLPVDDECFSEATNLISRYPQHPLRTLDALHLAIVARAGIATLATADTVMAETAESMGFLARRF